MSIMAYRAGGEDYRAGKSANSNPFEEDKAGHSDWSEGWYDEQANDVQRRALLKKCDECAFYRRAMILFMKSATARQRLATVYIKFFQKILEEGAIRAKPD